MERLKDELFALIGVNSDKNLDALQEVIKKEKKETFPNKKLWPCQPNTTASSWRSKPPMLFVHSVPRISIKVVMVVVNVFHVNQVQRPMRSKDSQSAHVR